MGGVGTSPSTSPGVNTSAPTGKIGSGQSFFIKGLASGNALFNNAMRIAGNNTQFYRAAEDRSRIWLQISDGAAGYKQMLVGYADAATNGIESGYDGDLFDIGNPVMLYSLVGNNKLTIQGRALPFNATDVVPLGYKATENGNLTISLYDFDGIFITENIFLKDKVLNLIHDLKAGDYVFATVPGTFEDRFEIVYTNGALGGQEFQKDNALVLYNPDGTIRVLSTESMISSIKVFDLRGGLLTAITGVNSFEKTVPLQVEQQVLLFEIQLDTGQVVYRKYIK
jgi:hypothetical protein